MFDLNRTLALVKGALFDAEATWRDYLPQAGDWQKTAFLLTGPLIITSLVIAYLGGLTSDGSSLSGMFRPTIVSTILSIVMAAIGVAVGSLIFSSIAGAFGGKSNFSLGLAALTLAFVPGYLGQALGWLPWIGGLLVLGLGIYSLVQLWRILPLYLEVPPTKRVAHYVLSLIATIIAMVIIGSVFGRFMPGADMRSAIEALESAGSDSALPGSGGIFSSAMRQAEMMSAAQDDQYAAPSDGEVSEAQVKAFIRVMDRATEVRKAKESRLRALAEKADNDGDVSFADMSDMMGSAVGMAGYGADEIEIVKTAGGNWAEHVWVRDALRTAWMQKDINDAVKHNYSLYEKYEDDLVPYIAR